MCLKNLVSLTLRVRAGGYLSIVLLDAYEARRSIARLSETAHACMLDYITPSGP